MNVDPFQGIIDALNEPLITDWISAAGSALTFLVAIGALVYASRQVSEARRAREQTRELEQEGSQPYVVMYTEASDAGQQAIIDLVIKNYGVTAARDVRVSIDPWPTRSVDRAGGNRVAIPEVIPILAPGQEWRTMWDSGLQRKDSGLPDVHRGQMTFKGIGGKQLESPVVLDWNMYKTRRWVVVYGQHEIADALREIRREVKRWTEGTKGLSVYSRDGDALDERYRQEFEERMAEIEAEQAPPTETTSEATDDEDVTRLAQDGEPQETELPTDDPHAN